ncbi:MAG: transposase [Clostridiales bacterium]|nr:transposase [Clostridiales bacterium]
MTKPASILFCTENTLIPSAEKKLSGEFPVGSIGAWVLSPLQFNGTMDDRLFEFWFENCLLRECPSNSVIVMDNAAFHRKKRLISLAESSKHKIVFLPPYSPEYNPIEKFWAWLKRKLRKELSYFDSFDDCLRYCFNSIKLYLQEPQKYLPAFS